MGRPPAPCGTQPAYRRHLRHGEEPCDPCRDAHAAVRRKERGGRRRAAIEAAIATCAPRPGPVSAKDDLKASRDALVAAIGVMAVADPSKLPGLTRELRETWKALDGLDVESSEGGEDEFTRARRERAERAAGA